MKESAIGKVMITEPAKLLFHFFFFFRLKNKSESNNVNLLPKVL